ncbi:mucin-5AC-like [Haliotis rubra]|uniref:mucin-5AC-like n=1 Tax=Haliotis rubra TaxID=36100 RepID=UPI001EE5B838|nr:mucin-5AC-like [Haliotis rubra]
MDLCIWTSILLLGTVDAMFNMPANFPMPQGYPCDVLDKQCPGDMVCRMVATNCFNPPCEAVMACIDPPPSTHAACQSGFPLVAADRRREITCTPGGMQCPKESSCAFDPSENLAVCCWKVYKKGQCPKPTGPGFCARLCQDDGACPGDQKCCSNGCGTQCMDRMSLVPGNKPGSCPMMPPTINGPCTQMCIGDFMCAGMMKCCPSSCGRTCVNTQPGLPGMTPQGNLPPGRSQNFLGRLQSLFNTNNPGGVIPPSQMDSFFSSVNSPSGQSSWQQQQNSNIMQTPSQSGSMQQNQRPVIPGMQSGFGQGMANNPQSSQSGYSPAPSPGYPNNMQKGYPAGFKQGFPASQQGYQTGSKPGYPARSQPGFPSRTQSGFPAGSQSGFPANSQTGPPTIAPQGFQSRSPTDFPSGTQRGFPMQSQPMFPPGSQPGYKTLSQEGVQNRSMFSPMGFLGAQVGTRSQPTFPYPNNFQQGVLRPPQQGFTQPPQNVVQGIQPPGPFPNTGSQSGIQTAASSGLQQTNRFAPQTVSNSGNTKLPGITIQQPSIPKPAEPTFLIDIQPPSNLDQQIALQTALESIMAKNRQSTEPSQPSTTVQTTEQPTQPPTESSTELPTTQTTESAPTSTITADPPQPTGAGEWSPQTSSTAVDITDTSTSTADPATTSTSSQIETTSEPTQAASSQNSPPQASSAEPMPISQVTQPDVPSTSLTSIPQGGGSPKPGTCPLMSAVGTCKNTCMVDTNCLANYKCCNIGPCTVCMYPEMVPKTCSWEKRMLGGC